MKNSVTCFICLQSCDSHSFVYLDSIRKKFDKQQQQSTIGAKTKEKKKTCGFGKFPILLRSSNAHTDFSSFCFDYE